MKIHKLIILSLFIIGISCEKPPSVNTGIIPQPNIISYQQGSFQINEKTVIVVDETKEGLWVANELASFLQLNFNLNLQISSQIQENAIQLIIFEENIEKGAYSLDVSKKGVLIKGATYQGVFYGL